MTSESNLSVLRRSTLSTLDPARLGLGVYLIFHSVITDRAGGTKAISNESNCTCETLFARPGRPPAAPRACRSRSLCRAVAASRGIKSPRTAFNPWCVNTMGAIKSGFTSRPPGGRNSYPKQNKRGSGARRLIAVGPRGYDSDIYT